MAPAFGVNKEAPVPWTVYALKERTLFWHLLRVISFSFGETSHGLSLVVPSDGSDFDIRLIYLMSARHTASRRVACFRRGLLYIVAGCVAVPSLGFACEHSEPFPFSLAGGRHWVRPRGGSHRWAEPDDPRWTGHFYTIMFILLKLLYLGFFVMCSLVCIVMNTLYLWPIHFVPYLFSWTPERTSLVHIHHWKISFIHLLS